MSEFSGVELHVSLVVLISLVDIASYSFMTSLRNAFWDSHHLIILVWLFLIMVKIQAKSFTKILKLLTSIVLLHTWLEIEAWLLMMFYSETDDQMKNMNAIMKQYLQIYCLYLQDDWKKWLFLVKFTVNNMMNESTDMILFYMIYKQNSQIEFESQTEINEHNFMIKQLQQIDTNNFAD